MNMDKETFRAAYPEIFGPPPSEINAPWTNVSDKCWENHDETDECPDERWEPRSSGTLDTLNS